MPFSDPWGPYTSVLPVRHSLVNHTKIAISVYHQVPLLHLGGVRQWFTGGSAKLLRAMTGIRTHDLAHVNPESYPNIMKRLSPYVLPNLTLILKTATFYQWLYGKPCILYNDESSQSWHHNLKVINFNSEAKRNYMWKWQIANEAHQTFDFHLTEFQVIFHHYSTTLLIQSETL